MKIFNKIIRTFRRWTVGSPVKKLFYLRAKHNSSSSFMKYYYAWRYHRLLNRYNSSIPFSVTFDDIPTFPHGVYGVFISMGARIGKNCVILHQVTIGSNTLKDSKHFGAPTLGDNVYVGAGAKIIGGISIGNNVRIGANCSVAENIPDNSTVVATSRIILHVEPRDNKFISYKL